MSEVKRVWNAEGNSLYLSYPSSEFEELENAVYTVGIDQYGRFYLSKVKDNFEFDYKIYGLERDLINRVVKTYAATNFNLGVLMNGLKGTGKTVSSKILANELGQPVILVGTNDKGLTTFLNAISQDITIFIDEYEKIFAESSVILTIMDGAMNSVYKRAFLLTTNKLYLDSNILQRPGRIRYLKTFENLNPNIVEEIIDDILVNKSNKMACINFISLLETITVDIVKSIVEECNIHNEFPDDFETVFNVTKLKGKFNVSIKEKDNTYSLIAENVKTYPRPDFNDDVIGYSFSIDDKSIGTVGKVINQRTIEVEPYRSGDNKKSIGFDEKITLKFTNANMTNYAYGYGDYDGFEKAGDKKLSTFAENIIKALDKDNDNESESNDMVGFVDDSLITTYKGSAGTAGMGALIEEAKSAIEKFSIDVNSMQLDFGSDSECGPTTEF